MKLKMHSGIPSKQELLTIADDEIDFIKSKIMVGILKLPSCWKAPVVVVSGERLIQTLMVGKEPRHRKNSKGKNYYVEAPDQIVGQLSDIGAEGPSKINHPLQGKYTTENVIYLYYNTINDKALELGLKFEDYFRQVVAHEVFHSIHFAYVKEYFYKGCCANNWEMAEAFAVDYWSGKGMKRNQVIAVREGLARVFECGWCLIKEKFEQSIKLEEQLKELCVKEPTNPYGKGIGILKRYEGMEGFPDSKSFAICLLFGILLDVEISAVYNKNIASMNTDNGWEMVYRELNGRERLKSAPSLKELIESWTVPESPVVCE